MCNKRMWWLLALMLFAFPAWAAPKVPIVKVKIVKVQGPYTLSEDAFDRMFFKQAEKLPPLGLNISWPLIELGDPNESLNHLATNKNYFYAWFKTVRAMGLFRGGYFVHVVAPPMVEADGNRWLGGWSYVCGGFSLSNAQEFNNRNEGRIGFSSLAFIHEQGHAFGAIHDPMGWTIMAPASNANEIEVRGLPDWSDTSLKQIRRCMRGYYPKNKKRLIVGEKPIN